MPWCWVLVLSLFSLLEWLYLIATETIFQEVQKLISAAMDQTLDLIKKHKSAVAMLAERLLEKEVLKYKDVQEVLGPRPLPDYIYSEESDDETDTSSEED